jgi:hypothetical protein
LKTSFKTKKNKSTSKPCHRRQAGCMKPPSRVDSSRFGVRFRRRKRRSLESVETRPVTRYCVLLGLRMMLPMLVKPIKKDVFRPETATDSRPRLVSVANGWCSVLQGLPWPPSFGPPSIDQVFLDGTGHTSTYK